MQSATRLAVSAFLITSIVAATYQSSTKLRRNGVLNLYPFPRVGRASSQTWQLPPQDLLEYTGPEEKRQLYAFPRVGRSDVLPLSQLSMLQQMHHSRLSLNGLMELMSGRGLNRGYAKRELDTGMWFGPRLGRPSKSSDDEDIATPIQNNDSSEPEQIEQELIDNREKRQTK